MRGVVTFDDDVAVVRPLRKAEPSSYRYQARHLRSKVKETAPMTATYTACKRYHADMVTD